MSEPTCSSCSRVLISQTVWYRADLEQRAAWSKANLRLAKGRGLCVNCYTVARRHSALPKPATPPPVTAPLIPCRRCGIEKTTGLCSDCRDVTADLAETSVWVA